MSYDALDRRRFLSFMGLGAATTALMACGARPAEAAETYPVMKSDAQWRAQLGPAYDVMRQEGTERPYSSPLNDEHRAGIFSCKGCAQPAFSSKTKFDSGTGWPSFWAPLSKGAIGERRDTTLGMVRTEVHCSRCGSHLGHVFDDGPKPTGLRYCMNGIAMTFKPA